MGKVIVTFESSELANGSATFTFASPDQYDTDMKEAVLASQDYGYVVETKTVEVQEGVDANNEPIMVEREVTTRSPASFEVALKQFAKDVIADRIVENTNLYRTEKAKAIALAKVSVAPIEAVEE